MNLDSDLIQSSLLQLGWSDRELSRRTGIGYNRLIEVIWNLTDDATQMEAHRIADALKIPYSDIMVDEETPYRERFRNMKPLDRFALKKADGRGKGGAEGSRAYEPSPSKHHQQPSLRQAEGLGKHPVKTCLGAGCAAGKTDASKKAR